MTRPRGGDWLEEEMQWWGRSGVDVIVSLLTAEEIKELGLTDEEALARANGIEFFSYPIPDRGVPSSSKDFVKLVMRLADLLAADRSISIHCRQSIGRAGMVAIALLMWSGVEPAAAMEQVGTMRGCAVPETDEQKRWITDLAGAFAPGWRSDNNHGPEV